MHGVVGNVLLDIHGLSEVEEFNGSQFQALKIIKTAGKREPPTAPGRLNSVKKIKVSEADTIRQFALETRGMGMMGQFKVIPD